MKICLYSLSPKTGGGVIVKTLLLLRYLIKNNHEVVWVYPRVDGILPLYVQQFLEAHEIHTIEIKTIPYLRVFDSIDFFREIKGVYDVYQVVSGYCLDGMVFNRVPQKYFIWSATTLRSEKYSVKFINIKSLKHLLSYNNIKIGLSLEQYAARHAYKIFAASSLSRLKIISELNLESTKVEVINPIIDTERYSYKSISSRPKKEDYVLYMGIFSERKNIDLLVRSFVHVHRENKHIQLKLVGKLNGFGEYFEKLIKSLDLESCVEIVGEVADNTIWYQNAICTVLTSYEEGFGMVLAESLSCGTPVIATNSGGVSDIVKDGINGFLVAYDEKEISQSILKLHEDIDMRERFSTNGRKHVENLFSIDTVGSKILAEYHEFLYKKNNDS